MQIQRLTLTDFRNYKRCVWKPSSSIAVLTGPNGSGKTNLLEALSLLSPGKGFHSAPSHHIQRHTSTQWGVAAHIKRGDDSFRLATGSHPSGSGRRIFLLDDEPVRPQSSVAEHYACVWLIPRMERIFHESASGRRRFLDRLTVALTHDHARQLAAHERSVTSRNRVLSEQPHNNAWLTSLEESISRHAVAAVAARLHCIDRLHTHAHGAGAFPHTQLELHCPIAEKLKQHPALYVEEWLKTELRHHRSDDRVKRSTSLGAHKSDFSLYDATTARSASHLSSGQQKIMLLSLILSHAHCVTELWGDAPVILLDEPLVHLDEKYRLLLMDSLKEMQTTILLTGTDKETFMPLQGYAEFVHIDNGILSSESL